MKHFFILIALIFIFSPVLQAKKYKVFYLGGQSNMDGFGYNNQLPAELDLTVDGVYIFHGNSIRDSFEIGGQGVWDLLKPGHGTGHSSNFEKNNLSDRFGVEITFAREMKKMFPNENIALIKYSRGGTSIHIDAAGPFGCWDPDFTTGTGANQYDHFLATVNNAYAIKDIDGDGEADELIPAGILWMQGESDANNPEIANLYLFNLKRLMDLIRAVFRVDDLPVVIGRISDSGNDSDGKVWDFGNVVRWQQAKFANQDKNAALVTSTDNYGYSDKWQYDTEGYVDFGKQFAIKMQQLLLK
ncbi:MAG TPA: sialate O-acetylesterase [Draconibacterium sp.]|nr:sialate O-acetylesterase [Draconibacterium sp.]